MKARVLIIDDEDLFRESLAGLLREEGYECHTASAGDVGLALFETVSPDVVLCDITMPGKGGIEVLDAILKIRPESLVVMITAYGTLQSAVEAFRKGASDYITKPLVIEDVLQKIGRLVKYKNMAQEVRFLRREISQDLKNLTLVGQSEEMQRVLDLVARVAPTRSTVLITGESGTGKELVARAIHEMSASEQGTLDAAESELPFVAINCAGIPGELLESELFGHVRGAFTGAIAERVGHFELAQGGTLLLDEVAELPLPLQSKLLRVLDEKTFVRVGGTAVIPLRARIITATNKDLRARAHAGEFRGDLFFRIAVFEIALPALRDRWHDIPLLVDYFVKKLNKELKRNCLGVAEEAMQKLRSHPWPGNVRELRNVLERAMILSSSDRIIVADLPGELRDMDPSPKYSDDLREALHGYEAGHIRRVLFASGWNKEEAARRLGVNPSTLYRKMAGLGIAQEEGPPMGSEGLAPLQEL